MSIQKIDPNYNGISYEDIKNCKNLNEEDIDKEFKKLVKLNCLENVRSYCCNRIIYHYQLENMLKTKRDISGFKLLEEIFNDEDLKKKLIDRTIKMNRRKKYKYIQPVDIYEAYRRNGSITCFKAPITKHLCLKYNATSMLDFTAGWGGRLLGARSLDINYIGIDTNINLKEGYLKMIEKFGGTMIWDSCLNVDFSTLDYDFVLTSPPYVNLELYENMTLFENKEKYYKMFLIPMIEKSLKYIKNNGKVCINISALMYDDYIKYGGTRCVEKVELLKKKDSQTNSEYVYVFEKLGFNSKLVYEF